MKRTLFEQMTDLHNAWIELLVALGVGKAVCALNNALLRLQRWIS